MDGRFKPCNNNRTLLVKREPFASLETAHSTNKTILHLLQQFRCIYTMMTSSNGNIFRVTGHLCGEFTGPRVNSPHKGQWRGGLMFSLICAWINRWVNNREAGDLRRYHAHYDVTVMILPHKQRQPTVQHSTTTSGTKTKSLIHAML